MSDNEARGFTNKDAAIATLRQEFETWDALLSGLRDEQVEASFPGENRRLKDEVAHLWEWQTESTEIVRAAHEDREPDLVDWFRDIPPEADNDVDAMNEFLYERNRDKSWDQIYSDWRKQFEELIELAQSMPESDLLAVGKYEWFGEFRILDELESTYEHHHIEHLPKVRTLLEE